MNACPGTRILPLIGLALALTAAIASAQPAPVPAPAPAAPPPPPREGPPPPNPDQIPHYPVPYQLPAAADVKAALDRICARLETGAAVRVIDRRSGEVITDFSAPHPGAVMDPGPERKFAQLSYPMGVVHAGMLLTAEVTGDRRYADFTAQRFQFFADHLVEFQKWGVPEGFRRYSNPFANLLAPDSLDACGAMGSAMIKARQAKVGPDLLPVINRFAEYISHGQQRLADGTLSRNRPRPDSVWGDDLYMSVPFLAQMGRLTGERRYFDDAVRQVVQISDRLFNPALGLYAHAWNAGNADDHPRYYWGRANGWCIMAMVELLSELPDDHPERAQVLRLLRAHARGLAETQSGSGLWHQLLDRTDSYLESSCTAMFTFSLARAVNRGWLDAASYGPVAVAGWNGLSTRITPEGKVEGTCVGTNYANDAIYYYNRPSPDDVHGYGPALLAGAEMIRLVQNQALHPSFRRGAPVLFNETFDGAPQPPNARPPGERSQP